MSTGINSMRTFKTVEETGDSINKNKKKKHNSNINILKFIPWILIVILVGFSIFLWHQYDLAKRTLNSSSINYNSQIETQLSKLIVLPSDKPTILTIKNATSLKVLPFFSGSKTGDVVLIYPKEVEAIIYRSSENKIINVSTNPTEIQSLDNIIFHS